MSAFKLTALSLATFAAVHMNETDGAGNDLGGVAPAPETPKTKRELLVEKANAFAEKYNDILAQIKQIDDKAAAEAKVANLTQGDRVDAVVGKGEKAQTLVNALVLGVLRTEEKGVQIKIQVGAGFDTQTYILTPAQVQNVFTAEELAAAQQVPLSEEDQALVDQAVDAV